MTEILGVSIEMPGFECWLFVLSAKIGFADELRFGTLGTAPSGGGVLRPEEEEGGGVLRPEEEKGRGGAA